MKMGIECTALTCDKPIYYAGEVINGLCTVTVTSPTHVTSVEITFEGCADVEWSETKTRSYTDSEGKSQSESYTESYSSHQNLITIHRDIVVQGSFMNPGTYNLPFSIPTPYTLISSFEGFHGKVRYSIKAKKSKAGLAGFFTRSLRNYVKILQPIDTNIPMYQFPVSGTDTKTICCCCCASGPLTIEARTDRAAYCPGEKVYLTARFENNSSRTVKPYVRLVQHQRYYAEGSQNDAYKNWSLNPLSDGGETTHLIAEGGCVQWNGLAFMIPACFPSLKCEIIDVSYHLEVAMDIPMAVNLRVSLPIVLATIGFRGPQVVTQQVSGGGEYPTGWCGFGEHSRHAEPSAPPIALADDRVNLEAPPPSYFETVFAAADSSEKVEKDKKK